MITNTKKNTKNTKLILKDGYDSDDENHNFLLKKEVLEGENRSNQFDFLYPNLDDPKFNIKIAQKKEFSENRYDGKITDSENLEKYSNQLCNSDFELNPHQLFVKNFLSFNTPYNSLLLYHGLGTGKTCTAITIAEEMRDYLKQLTVPQKIMVIASPNVQENFKLQLFDERKLELINGIWTINSNCVGNKFLKELNPTGISIDKSELVLQIKHLIRKSYMFMGYREFANYINHVDNIDDISGHMNSNKIIELKKKKIQKIFNDRLIIIDEVHNIRLSGTTDKHDKKIANSLTKLVKYTDNMRLLLLSGTPMYNHYSEIIWIINLMNLNDNRSEINKTDIFDNDGNFIKDKDGNEIGKDLFIHKITGYVSFVRGENPYIFPYRIYPFLFETKNSLKSIQYPRNALNDKIIPLDAGLQYMDVYITYLHDYQSNMYNYIIQQLKKKINNRLKESFDNMDKFGYNDLQHPLEALNITYPIHDFNEDSNIPINQLVGKTGLQRIMNFDEKEKTNYEYNSDIKEKFGNIFSLSTINKYSSKIFSICKNIIHSEGVILVYSQYIEGGLIPLALALEEEGYTRYGESSSLFEKNHVNKEKKKKNMKYVMITGDIIYSKNNNKEINACTNIDNMNGDEVKVILISRAGSEGIDLKYIRQVHIMEPWYNTSRIEQIIGRSVRNKSHCDLSFDKRNVQIFLYGTILKNSEEEAVDLYIYRVAESKAIQIGKVSRVLKETCVDCIIHYEQNNFIEEKFNKTIKIELSNKKVIENYKIGDKPYTNVCDYMSDCAYECTPNIKIEDKNINIDTYDKTFIEFNNDKIMKRIKLLFKEHYFISREKIINHLTSTYNYPIEHIDSALDYLINDKTELLLDRFGIHGRLINIDNYYLFQPNNIQNNNISVFDRSIVPSVKHKYIIPTFPKENDIINTSVKEQSIKSSINIENLSINIIQKLKEKYNKITKMSDVINGGGRKPLTEEVKAERALALANTKAEKLLLKEQNIAQAKAIKEQEKEAKILLREQLTAIKNKEETIQQQEEEQDETIQQQDEEQDEEQEEDQEETIQPQEEETSSKQIVNNKIKKENKDSEKAFNKIYQFLLANDDFKYKIKFEEHNNIQILNEIIIEHIIDNEHYKNKKILLDYLYFKDGLTTFEKQLKTYFDKQVLKSNESNIEGIWLYNDDSTTKDPSILLIKDNTSWEIAKMTDRKNFNILVAYVLKDIIKRINHVFGYISYIKKNNKYVFKSIDLLSVHKGPGKRCDQSGKADIIDLTDIIDETKKNIFSALELCCLQELLLRYYTHIKRGDKIWFLNTYNVHLFELSRNEEKNKK